jgi:hypothetical protein
LTPYAKRYLLRRKRARLEKIAVRVVILAGDQSIIGRNINTARLSQTTNALGTVTSQYNNIAATPSTYRTTTAGIRNFTYPENRAIYGYTGVGQGLAAALASQFPGEQIIYVPVAFGDTALVNGPWADSTGTANADAVDHINSLMATPGTKLHGIYWMGGITDATNAVSTAAYQTELEKLINGWRNRIRGNSEAIPFVIGALNPLFVSTTTGAPAIVAAQKAITLPNVRYVDSFIGFDNTTVYSASGNTSMGVALAGSTTICNETFVPVNGGTTLNTLDWFLRNGANASGIILNERAYVISNAAFDAPVQVYGTADYAISADLSFVGCTTQSFGIRARASASFSAMSGWTLRATCTTGTLTWTLRRIASGSGTGTGVVVGTFAEPLSADMSRNVRWELKGTSLRVLVDGVERIAVTDATYNRQGANGIYGIGTTATVGIYLDNYVVTTI